MSDQLLNLTQLKEILDNYQHTQLHIHHTWLPNHDNFTGDNYQSIQDGMRDYHMNQRGWSDIGQHVTLYPDGLFLTGRDFGRAPASITGHNTGAFAVEMLGNFDKGNDVLKGDQKEAILWLTKYFDDKGRTIIFHNEFATKTCPGTSIDKNEFMGEVTALGITVEEDEVSPWAKDARNWCVANGISDGTRPHDNVTREELWATLYRYHNK